MYFSLLDFHLDKDKVFLKKNIAFNKTFISLPLDEGMFSFHIIHWDKSVIGVFAPLSVLSAFHGASPKLCGNSPDSALHYLSLLKDSIRCEPEESQMYYHLLTIKAEDKLYTRHISDSLINLIVKFYNKYGDKNKQMEAYYYQGSVYRDLHDAPSALDAFHEVISRSKELSPADKKQSADLMARTYNQMGTLFAYQGLYDEALQANRESVNCYLAQGKKDKISYAFRDIARMYDAKHQKDSALH